LDSKLTKEEIKGETSFTIALALAEALFSMAEAFRFFTVEAVTLVSSSSFSFFVPIEAPKVVVAEKDDDEDDDDDEEDVVAAAAVPSAIPVDKPTFVGREFVTNSVS